MVQRREPASSGSSMILKLAAASASSPKFMVLSAMRLTFTPVQPRWVYCMGIHQVWFRRFAPLPCGTSWRSGPRRVPARRHS